MITGIGILQTQGLNSFSSLGIFSQDFSLAFTNRKKVKNLVRIYLRKKKDLFKLPKQKKKNVTVDNVKSCEHLSILGLD